MFDLYPGEDWNYVFGQAQLVKRCGVFSFARYIPSFYQPKMKNKTLSKNEMKQALWASIKVCTHEITHMFNIKHCVYYDCCKKNKK